jgi:hypothetical protein
MTTSTPSSLPDATDASPLDVLAERVRTHPNVQDKLDIHRAYEEPVGRTVSFEHPFFPDAAGEVSVTTAQRSPTGTAITCCWLRKAFCRNLCRSIRGLPGIPP